MYDVYGDKLRGMLLGGLLVSLLAAPLSAASAVGTGATKEQPIQPIPAKEEKMGGLSGTPVNIVTSGGVIVPKGMLLTALNYSFRDKDTIRDDNGRGARTFTNELYLLKIRYSPTDQLELIFVPGFVNNHLDAFGPNGSSHISGPTDFMLGGTYAFLSQRLGDPLSLSATLGVNMPTGQEGRHHPAGADAWGCNAKIGVTKVWHPKHRIDADIGIAQPMETGNGDVHKDTVLSASSSYHYVLNSRFDLGLEFILENSKEWERNGIGMKNKYTELYAGPTANYVIPEWNMWLGFGLLFPVLRDYDIPTASDDIRIEVKLGKIWSW